MRNDIRLLLTFFVISICSFAILLLSFLKYSIEQGGIKLQPAFNRPVLSNYVPKTGDILLMHYLSHGMIGIPVAEHWPTHAAFVWVKENGKVFVIECTKFNAPLLPNELEFTRDRDRGVRIVTFDNYINAVDNVVYVRQLKTGYIKSSSVANEVEMWAKHIDFETRIADSMTIDLTVAIGFVPVWPKLSEWCAKAAGLHDVKRRENRAFCSEFVSQLLQKLGAVDSTFQNHYQISPASFLKSSGALEDIASPSFSWKSDRMLVRRL